MVTSVPRLLDLLSAEPRWGEGEVCEECQVQGVITAIITQHNCNHHRSQKITINVVIIIVTNPAITITATTITAITITVQTTTLPPD